MEAAAAVDSAHWNAPHARCEPSPHLGTFLYTYDDGALVYEVRFESDERLHWKGVVGEDLGKEAYEDNYRVVIAPGVHFLNWKETSGQIVTQVLNFDEETVNTVMVLDGIHTVVKGTIKKVQENKIANVTIKIANVKGS